MVMQYLLCFIGVHYASYERWFRLELSHNQVCVYLCASIDLFVCICVVYAQWIMCHSMYVCDCVKTEREGE